MTNAPDLLRLELKELINNLKDQKRKHDELQIIKNIIQGSNESKLNPEVRSKITDSVMASDVQESLTIDSINLLSIKSPHLTLKEKESTNKFVQDAVMDMNKKIFKEIHFNMEIEQDYDKALFDLKRIFIDQYHSCTDMLQELSQLLEQMLQMRTEKITELCQDKVLESEILQKLTSCKIEIMNRQYKLRIFKETSESMQAYQTLIKSMAKKREDISNEITILRELRESYSNQQSLDEYNKILKHYLEYYNKIKK